jgi:hypothetical protein
MSSKLLPGYEYTWLKEEERKRTPRDENKAPKIYSIIFNNSPQKPDQLIKISKKTKQTFYLIVLEEAER